MTAPPIVAVDPLALPDPSDIWASDRPALAALRWESARRIVSPWTALGMCLIRSLLTIPYPVRYRSELHPEGTPVNALLAIVGRSGAGKSTAMHAAAHVVQWSGEDVPVATVARSGEGIPALFAYPQPSKGDDTDTNGIQWKRPDHAVWGHWDEVGMLASQGARVGSTILESVKSVTSGEQLGGQNARGDGLTLPAGSYRAVLSVAVQPRRASLLLTDETVSGGLAARFLWFQAEDAEAAARPKPTRRTEPVHLPLDQWSGVQYVDALPEMDAAHEADTRAALRGDRDAIHSRRQLNRAVVAIALANMDGRAVLVPEDWHLAGSVLAHSDDTLDGVLDAIAEPDTGDADLAERRERAVLERVAVLQQRGTPWRDVMGLISKPQRDTFRAMLADGRIGRW